MPLGRLVSGSSSQLSTPTLDKMTRAIRAKGSLPSRTHAMQGVVVKGERNLSSPARMANRSRRSRRPLTAESGKTASASRLAQAKTGSAPGQRRCSAKSGAIE